MICENCGKPLEAAEDIVFSFVNGDSIHAFCKQCSFQFGTCAMCANISCGFFNDPDPMPQMKVITRQMRQGNATFVEQKQIPNGDRIKKFCIDGGCPCYNGDAENPLCCRFGGCATCTNYCEIEQYKFG